MAEGSGRDSTTPKNVTPCARCVNLVPYTLTCLAFARRIPASILSGDNDHTQPFPGDNGIQFEERNA